MDAFYNNKWGAMGDEIVNPIGCADCHEPENMNLHISRPALIEAFARQGKDITKATPQEMRSLVCAQCHVEYYFKGDGKYLTFPWDKGFTVEDMEAYYDNEGFYDYIHKLSRAPILKAQHPDYEICQMGIHGQRGVSCADCHMPYKSEGGVKFSDHHIQSPLAMIDRTCQTCHRESEATLRNNVYERQRKANEIRNRLEQELAKAHIEAKFAWDKGATEDQMKDVLALIRQAQWRWDFGVASHGGSFHAPQEIQRILSHGLDKAMQARLAVSRVLAKHGFTDDVPMPDISTKEKAQQYIGLDIEYHCMVPYAEWMNGSVLSLHRSDYGCCNTLLAKQTGMLGRHSEAFFPELVYVRPQGLVEKRDSLEGSAFIDFPVDQTAIFPGYRHNTAELGKIQSSIDSVQNDMDITITSVWLKGYASPESPYAHNKELAIGRTAALKKHIQQLYQFEGDMITTGYEAEDWAGLRRYVERSNLEHRTKIIALIDANLEPDAKEWKIKSTYPEEYRFLLQNCYPALRRTDYRIAYTIRSYSDVEEIKRIMHERPQKLSLNEFYLVAREYEPGTDEFTEVFETAVRMFPDDTVANLNAANAAMRRGDLTSAKRYLAKADDSPEAVYARGALAILQKDYDSARRYLSEAKTLGSEQAGITLEQLEKGRH